MRRAETGRGRGSARRGRGLAGAGPGRAGPWWLGREIGTVRAGFCEAGRAREPRYGPGLVRASGGAGAVAGSRKQPRPQLRRHGWR